MSDRDWNRPNEGDDGDGDSPLEQIVAGVVIALVFLVAFGLLVMDYRWFWVAFPVGFAGLLPAAIGLVRWYERRHDTADRSATARPSTAGTSETDRALATLRDRYASGELDEEEFERRLERLLSTETANDARAELHRRESAPEVERETERTDNR
ncbi:SHOCT domain-containing protein [Haloprofundus salilacus]|uniref:SHOCT domain-containing protein n=1 Tax=Haloprofundus salilacus TaxID=2876190 RepID=UPI001CD01287|nr:SHOCT domain-containing protein [Haloprofundus salilacus]